MKQDRATLWAALLVLCAVSVPATAWFVTGKQRLDEQTAQLRQRAHERAQEELKAAASRVDERLRALTAAESRRPFFHYQRYFHDPEGAYEGVAVSPSPLADAPPDPLIGEYFQIEPDGSVTTPSKNALAPALVKTLHALAIPQPSPTTTPPPQQQQVAELQKVPSQRKVFAQEQWLQNAQAPRLYEDIRSNKKAALAAPPSNVGSQVEVTEGDLKWTALTTTAGPVLAALRRVDSPTGAQQQGFTVRIDQLETLTAGHVPPMHVKQTRAAGDVAMPVANGAFFVVMDAFDDAALDADVLLGGGRRAFGITFLLGVILAALAGAGAVLLVWQSQRLARQRSQFAASAAHELRTPLAGLRMYAEMLAFGLGDRNRTAEYASTIAQEAERLGRVVTNMLGFSRLERGALTIKPESVDVEQAIAAFAEQARPWLQSAGATLKVEASKMPPVSLDRDAFHQIVSNLVDNAEKYSRDASDRAIVISSTENAAEQRLCISVRDHGPGVPVAFRARLFQPFARGVDGDGPAGLGLGLALVRALALAHGGSVECKNALDGGAVFTVSLPMGSPSA